MASNPLNTIKKKKPIFGSSGIDPNVVSDPRSLTSIQPPQATQPMQETETNPPVDEFIAKAPSYKVSKIPGSNLMSQLNANQEKMQSDLDEVDKNSTVQKQFNLMQQLQRTIVDPVDRAKFEEDKAAIESEYQSSKSGKESARSFTLVAEGLANILGGVIASQKGIGYSPVKFEGIDWDKQINRLGDEAAGKKSDVDKSLAAAMTQQSQAQDAANLQYSDKANILGTGIQLGQAEDSAKRGLITQLGGQAAQGITAAAGDERARQEFGAQDTQRKNEYDYRTFNDTENRKLQKDKLAASERIAAAKAAGKGDKDGKAAMNAADEALINYQKALSLLDTQGVTGLFQGTVGRAWDKVMGNPEAATRLLLQKLKVDDTLLRVAQTKGAVSNHEMKLFMAPTPDMIDDEETWKTWIIERAEAAQRIKDRMQNGVQVPIDERASFNPTSPKASENLNDFVLMEAPTGERENVHKSQVPKYLKMKAKVVE